MLPLSKRISSLDLVFSKVFAPYYSSFTMSFLISSHFNTRRHCTKSIFTCLKEVMRSQLCVLHFPTRIIHLLQGSLSSRLSPLSSTFHEEILYFSCLQGEPVLFRFSEVDLSFMSTRRIPVRPLLPDVSQFAFEMLPLKALFCPALLL